MANQEISKTAPKVYSYQFNSLDWYPVCFMIPFNIEELLNAAESTIRMKFEYGKTYLLRLVNALMNRDLFFMIAGHNLTVVGWDAGYVIPVTTDYIFISTGQTSDILVTANQKPGEYYMIATPYFDAVGTEDFDSSTASAIFQYTGNYTQKTPYLPAFVPNYVDMASARAFVEQTGTEPMKDKGGQPPP
ncbi:hypothetical protein SLA2020_300820 [Shorea laevis]